MKILAKRSNLADVFQLTERFIAKNLTLPILGNVFFEADGNRARCVATNLEIGVEATIPCKVIKAGAVTIPGRVMHTVIQSLNEDMVALEEKDAVITVKTDSSHFSIQGNPSADFPQLPKIKKEHEFSVPAAELKKSIAQVLPAAAVSDFKPELASVFFQKDQKTLTLAATDSFRLSERTVPLSSQGDACAFILPARACQELLRVLPDSEDAVLVREGENQALFDVGDTRIVSRLVDGAYPNYKAIIPNEFESHFSMPKEEFVQKIKAASILSSKLNDIAIHFSSGESSLETSNLEMGKSKIQLAAKTKGKAGRVVFNFRYLLDGVEAVAGDEVTVSLHGDAAPALIRDQRDSTFLYVVMPIRNV